MEDTSRVIAKAGKKHTKFTCFSCQKRCIRSQKTRTFALTMLNGKNSTSSIRLLHHHDNTRYFLLPPIPIASNHFDLLELELRKDWNTRANNPSKQLCQLVLCLKLLAPGSGAAGTQTNVQVYKLFHKKLTQHTNTHTQPSWRRISIKCSNTEMTHLYAVLISYPSQSFRGCLISLSLFL